MFPFLLIVSFVVVVKINVPPTKYKSPVAARSCVCVYSHINERISMFAVYWFYARYMAFVEKNPSENVLILMYYMVAVYVCVCIAHTSSCSCSSRR